MIKKLIILLFEFLIWMAYRAYRIEGVNALLLLMPGKLIVPTLRKYGAKIGEEVTFHSPIIIHNAKSDYSNLEVGNQVYFGKCVFLDLKEKVTIEDRVTLSMSTMVLTHTDAGQYSRIVRVLPASQAPVSIHCDAYVGANAIILQGVEVGPEAIIGAGSVVRHSVPPKTVVVGNPAKEIRKIS